MLGYDQDRRCDNAVKYLDFRLDFVDEFFLLGSQHDAVHVPINK